MLRSKPHKSVQPQFAMILIQHRLQRLFQTGHQVQRNSDQQIL